MANCKALMGSAVKGLISALVTTQYALEVAVLVQRAVYTAPARQTNQSDWHE